MKKEIGQTIKNGVIMGTVALIIVCAGFYIFIRARSDIKITTETEPNKLYVGAGEALTAAKRNAMIDNSFHKDCIIYSGGNSTSAGRSYKTLSCPSDYPNMVAAGCDRSWANDEASYGYPSGLNTRTCKIRVPSGSHSTSNYIKLKCCK